MVLDNCTLKRSNLMLEDDEPETSQPPMTPSSKSNTTKTIGLQTRRKCTAAADSDNIRARWDWTRNPYGPGHSIPNVKTTAQKEQERLDASVEQERLDRIAENNSKVLGESRGEHMRSRFGSSGSSKFVDNMKRSMRREPKEMSAEEKKELHAEQKKLLAEDEERKLKEFGREMPIYKPKIRKSYPCIDLTDEDDDGEHDGEVAVKKRRL